MRATCCPCTIGNMDTQQAIADILREVEQTSVREMMDLPADERERVEAMNRAAIRVEQDGKQS